MSYSLESLTISTNEEDFIYDQFKDLILLYELSCNDYEIGLVTDTLLIELYQNIISFIHDNPSYKEKLPAPPLIRDEKT